MSEAVRVTHLTSAHRAGDSRIFHRECRSLAEAGFDVELVAPDCRPETRDGVRLLHVPRPTGRLDRATRLAWRILRLARSRRSSIYHFHDPELLPVGVTLALLGGRVVYDVHEDYREQIAQRAWIPAALRRPVAMAVGLGEQAAVKAFAGVVAVTPGIAEKFPPEKTEVVQNFPSTSEFTPPSAAAYARRPNVVVYTGEISILRGAREMVQAIDQVESSSTRLVLAGRAPSTSLMDELKRMPGWGSVDYRGWVERGALPSLFDDCRVGLALLHPVKNYLTAQPIKLFEYMAAGVPVVASNFPAWRPFVADVGAGLMVDPCRPDEVAGAISKLLREPMTAWEMGQRGNQAVRERFGWESQRDRLVSLYHRLLA